MAEPTAQMAAILEGLSGGGQVGLAEMIRTEIANLERLVPDDAVGPTLSEEDRRQAKTADEVVTRVIKAEIYQREQLREISRSLRIQAVETIDGSSSVEGGRTIEVLTDEQKIVALQDFLKLWQAEIRPLRGDGRVQK